MGDLGESFRDYREYQQKIREHKYNKFCSVTIPKLKESSQVISIIKDSDKFVINTTEFGIIDIFPKANRLLIRRDNQWHSMAVNWLIKNIL